MKHLLDTHLLLWAAFLPELLPEDARAIILDRGNTLYFSTAAVWECAIKRAQNRSDFQFDPFLFRQRLLAAGYRELPIHSTHAIALATLPPIHKDPFDRILIAQAMVENYTLLTADSLIAQYPGPIRKI